MVLLLCLCSVIPKPWTDWTWAGHIGKHKHPWAWPLLEVRKAEVERYIIFSPFFLTWRRCMHLPWGFTEQIINTIAFGFWFCLMSCNLLQLRQFPTSKGLNPMFLQRFCRVPADFSHMFLHTLSVSSPCPAYSVPQGSDLPIHFGLSCGWEWRWWGEDREINHSCAHACTTPTQFMVRTRGNSVRQVRFSFSFCQQLKCTNLCTGSNVTSWMWIVCSGWLATRQTL